MSETAIGIMIELDTQDRDFIIELIDHAISNDLSERLKFAEQNEEGFLDVELSEFDFEDIIGNLALEADHNEDHMISLQAVQLVDTLEVYERQLKRGES